VLPNRLFNADAELASFSLTLKPNERVLRVAQARAMNLRRAKPLERAS
jgi:hypothetical protein